MRLSWRMFAYEVKPKTSPFVTVHLVDEEGDARCPARGGVPVSQRSRLSGHVLVCVDCLEIAEWEMNQCPST